MQILNLGCGTKTSPKVTNIDWSIYLSIKQNWFLRNLSPFFLNKERQEKLLKLDKNVLVHDIRNGLPFEDNSIDAVYHSHVFEHIDRSIAPSFSKEILRVLKPGGIHRIVVPDMEYLGKAYVNHLTQIEENPSLLGNHEDYISQIIEQMVRKEAYGTSRQPLLRKWVENVILGDARKRGETHQWMYDTFTLSFLLTQVGFKEIRKVSYLESSIPDWTSFGLDQNENGDEYLRNSLYLEARK